MLSRHHVRAFSDEIEKISEESGLSAYGHHGAQQAGKATKSLLFLDRHKAADDVAEKGTAKNIAAAVVKRVPEITGAVYKGAIPPQLQESPKKLKELSKGDAKGWFLHGYEPKFHVNPATRKRDASERTKSASSEDAALLGAALWLPSKLVQHLAESRLRKDVTNHLTTKKEDARLFARLTKLSPIKVNPAKKGTLGSYDVIRDKLYAEKGTNPTVLAHEMGHAELSRHAFGKVVQNPLTVVGANMATNVSPIAAIVASGIADPKARIIALAAPSIMKIPQLAYEAGASMKGIEKMEEAGATPKQIEKAKEQLLHAYLTYAGSMGATVGHALMGHALGKEMSK
jgi:Zn-dependent membrane protease YugP